MNQGVLAITERIMRSVDGYIDYLVTADLTLTANERTERNKFYGEACALNARLMRVLTTLAT